MANNNNVNQGNPNTTLPANKPNPIPNPQPNPQPIAAPSTEVPSDSYFLPRENDVVDELRLKRTSFWAEDKKTLDEPDHVFQEEKDEGLYLRRCVARSA
jgi:hypothetical protein